MVVHVLIYVVSITMTLEVYMLMNASKNKQTKTTTKFSKKSKGYEQYALSKINLKDGHE